MNLRSDGMEWEMDGGDRQGSVVLQARVKG